MNLKLQSLKLASPSELFENPLRQNLETPVNSKLSGLKLPEDKVNLSSLFNNKSAKPVPQKVTFDMTENPLPELKGPALLTAFSSATTSSVTTLHPLPQVKGQQGVSKSNTVSAISGIPERPAGAMTGSEFIEQTKGLSRPQREKAILAEIMKGNVPDFVRKMSEVNVSSVGPDGKTHTGTIKVIPDYLAIGSNQDFIRIPMDPLTAQKIADQTGTILPTRKIVNEVYKQAEVKFTPQPLPAGPQMMSNDYYQHHNQLVQQQSSEKGAIPGQLFAGHKKDVVITNMLDQKSGRVAIYGWHQPNGKAIQPLSTVHEDTYADYSHGIRLVNAKMMVDGEEKDVADVLHDPNLAGLISDEGVIRSTKIKI